MSIVFKFTRFCPRAASLLPMTVCLLFLSMTGVNAAEQKRGEVIEELPYGEILFDFYQQEYFHSLINILKADKQSLLDKHKDAAIALEGGLFLSYGMRAAAEQRLNTQFAATASSAENNRARYYQAKIAYQRGDVESAQSYLAAIDGVLPGELAGRDTYINALINLSKREYKAVITGLENWQGSQQISHYISYNLGLAWLRSEQTKKGVEVLDKLGRKDFISAELLALKDKANLSLGLHFLQQKDYTESRNYLDRIRLNGPHSAIGLLASGWVDVKMKAYRPALIPWKELRQRNLLDPFVQEAILVIPYALAESGLNKPSADAYEEALLLFEQEQLRLQSSIEALTSGGFVDDLVATASRVEMGWMRELGVVEMAPEPSYLYGLLSSHRVQESLKNYRDLLFLKENLKEWLASIDAFDDMLELRKRRFDTVVPLVEKMKKDDHLAVIQGDYNSIRGEFISAKDQDNLLKFATRDELDKFNRIDRLRKTVKARPDMSSYGYLIKRLDFLAGILFWDIYSDLPERVSRTGADIKSVKNEIRLSKNFISRINRLVRELPKGFENYEQNIRKKEAQLNQSLEKLTTVITEQKQQLVAVAVEELTNHNQRLERLKIQAIFALAQIYDRGTSSTQNDNKDKISSGEEG